MKTSSNLDMAWNVFKYCTVLRALGSVMILVVLGIIGVSYYAVVVAKYGPALFLGGLDSITALFVLFLFHSLLVMLVWSYFSVVITDPGGVPPNWIPNLDEESGGAGQWAGSDNDGVDLGANQSAMLIEPKHQGFYTFLETTLVTVSLLPIFIALFTDDEIPESPGNLAASFITFVLNLAFALSILGFLIMHISLVAGNTTTIEAFEKKTSPKWRYDLGWKINFEQVFGKNKKYWLIPAYSKDDLEWLPSFQCVEYPTRPDSDDL
ncbi:putative protein S-acyltransferase 14 [Citrus sinensis]|nr:putative protein S-acyltransferase 14 [Citrus sinensis]